MVIRGDQSAPTGNPVGEAFAAIVSCGVFRARGDTQRYQQARDKVVTELEKAVFNGSGSPMTWLFERMTETA